MKVFSTQCVVVLCSSPPALGEIRWLVEGKGYEVLECNPEGYEHWEMEGPNLRIGWRTEVGGVCILDVVDKKWPDSMGQPNDGTMVFPAWTMGHFGPQAFPGGLTRAWEYSHGWPDARKAVDQHQAFIRLRISYFLGGSPETKAAPADYAPLPELEWLVDLASVVMEHETATAYYNPNGEVLLSRELLAAHLNDSKQKNLPPFEAITGFRYYKVSEGWALADTVGMGQLDLPDHQISCPMERFDLNELGSFPLNTALYMLRTGAKFETGHTADGPGGQPWRVEVRESAFAPPPRKVLHWQEGDGDTEPEILLPQDGKPEKAAEASPPEDDPADDPMRALRADLQGWYTRRGMMRERATKWLKSEAFRDFYDKVHPDGKQWSQYQSLADNGEILFAMVIIANSALSNNPSQPVPALLVAPDVQDPDQLLVTGMLAIALGELYSSGDGAKERPKTARLLKDDRHKLWRRRRLPPDEVSGFEATLLDILLTKAFMPPGEIAFVPVLAAPGESGPQVLVPWHIATGQSAPASVPPPLPRRAAMPPPVRVAPAAVRPPQRKSGIVKWLIVLAIMFFGFLCFRVVQMIVMLSASQPKEITPVVKTLQEERANHQTVWRPTTYQPDGPADSPPRDVFQLVHYPSPAGSLAAYVTPDPKDGKRHPAMVWAHGGFGGIGASFWGPVEKDNDQTAGAFREAGIVLCTPSWRGENDNPGRFELFYGEVDDMLAAVDYVKTLSYVDPDRVYIGGHSTGGTLTLLCSVASDKFRAAFSFGGMPDGVRILARGKGYGNTPYDPAVVRESALRSPIRYTRHIKRPTFYFEGKNSAYNRDAREMQRIAQGSHVPFQAFELPGDHCDNLHAVTGVLAQKILADTGTECTIKISLAEMLAARRKVLGEDLPTQRAQTR